MDMGFTDSRAFDANAVEAALRPLGWSELCARLVAAQDLRRTQAGQLVQVVPGAGAAMSSGRESGSFHRGAARMLEHFDAGKDCINPTSSTYGKDNQGTSVDSRQTSLSACSLRQADENCHD
jgi:hypothetical protein